MSKLKYIQEKIDIWKKALDTKLMKEKNDRRGNNRRSPKKA